MTMDAATTKLVIICATVVQVMAMGLLALIAITHDGAAIDPVTTTLGVVAGGTVLAQIVSSITGAHTAVQTAKAAAGSGPAPQTVSVPLQVVPSTVVSPTAG